MSRPFSFWTFRGVLFEHLFQLVLDLHNGFNCRAAYIDRRFSAQVGLYQISIVWYSAQDWNAHFFELLFHHSWLIGLVYYRQVPGDANLLAQLHYSLYSVYGPHARLNY